MEMFIFDCDGVIWKGDLLIEGVLEMFELLRLMGKRLIFVTNNFIKFRVGYMKKFELLGLKVNVEEIFFLFFVVVVYLELIDFKKKAYVVGETGILEEFDGVGIKYIGGELDVGK